MNCYVCGADVARGDFDRVLAERRDLWPEERELYANVSGLVHCLIAPAALSQICEGEVVTCPTCHAAALVQVVESCGECDECLAGIRCREV